ncbi:EAL domain-containing protein [Acidocella facilis]|uniref:EAL domain-containing protein n=1 Tax=Acidocella facilis TaxID=525 RepID=UPI001F38FAEC|nr:EAL domain-containing protein [Acidocella facilis]
MGGRGEGGECAAALPGQDGMLAEMAQAIRRNELIMHYQPKIRLDTCEVVGFEALVRWQHGRKGLIGPYHFVPAVEGSPLLAAFTDKTIELALGQCALWQARGHFLKIAINISARMLEDDEFVPRLLRQLAFYEVPAARISLELTETALLVNLAKGQAMVHQLRDHGVSLSIDDFGAGYTSFTYLREFMVPEIKLDCAFVTDLEVNRFNASLVRSLAMFCEALGADFVAEGVERRDDWPTLLGLGCRIAQGYSIARPMAGEDVLPWLCEWSKPALALPA